MTAPSFTAFEQQSVTFATIQQLRQQVQQDVQTSWQVFEGDCEISELPAQKMTTIGLNEKGYLVWPKGHQVRWFYQEFVLPERLQDYPLSGLSLRLALTWWAEAAAIYVNGHQVQTGDLFDYSCRSQLSAAVQPGERVSVGIRLTSPGHDIGGLMRSVLIYESPTGELDPGFVADELAVLDSYLTAFAPEDLDLLAAVVNRLDWSTVGQQAAFHQSLQWLREELHPFSARLKAHTIFLVGHAHLDLAWLWEVEETWQAAERTFRSVLDLQQDFPELTFCHSTPALYEWVEQHRPELFAQIQQQVQAGRWEIVGGMWVEPEMNLISGEAIARQLLYGQRYCREKFGSICSVAWLPDSFGFNGQLPQFLKQGGIDYFVTQKLRWNDTTQFPHEVFQWQAPEGSRVLSVMSGPIGEGIDPIKLATHTWDWVKKTGTAHPVWLPGVGDHGGGPTRDMLEIARRWQRSPFFPKLQFTTALAFIQQLEKTLKSAGETEIPDSEHRLSGESPAFPVWQDELYLEFHRGCYTTHGDQKQFNRASEIKLYQAELLASLATIVTRKPSTSSNQIEFSYPKQALETAWKQVLFNQFHDILPGTSIPQVFVEANQQWQAADRGCEQIRTEAMKAIAQQIDWPEPPHPDAIPFMVFNPLNWLRSQVVTVEIPEGQKNWQICTLEGQRLDTKIGSSHATTSVAFIAADIPPIGYRCFWLCPEARAAELDSSSRSVSSDPYTLENEYLQVQIDPHTGQINHLFSKVDQREVLREPGNQLQAFQDSGQYWDAWNIDPHYAEHPLPAPQVTAITPVLSDRLQTSLQVTYQLGRSTIQQQYSLEAGSPLLRIATQVDWQERHVLLKTAFPLNLATDVVTCEIPCGVIQHPTRPQTDREKAKWEVSALSWADLSDGDRGVSLLTDYKHGYDVQPDRLRLTLLRGPEFPDPTADLGMHQFTYGIFPHLGTWQSAQIFRKAQEFNQPLLVMRCDRSAKSGTLPATVSLLDLTAENLILTALKQSETDPDTWIVRCYECAGESAAFNLTGQARLQLGESVDLLERSQSLSDPTLQPTQVQPWQVRSFTASESRHEV